MVYLCMCVHIYIYIYIYTCKHRGSGTLVSVCLGCYYGDTSNRTVKNKPASHRASRAFCMHDPELTVAFGPERLPKKLC